MNMEGVKKLGEHCLKMDNRKKLALNGITHVDTFNETDIELDSVMGKIAIRGVGLNITQLNLDAETLMVEGMIKAIIYTDKEGKGINGKRLLDKILR